MFLQLFFTGLWICTSGAAFGEKSGEWIQLTDLEDGQVKAMAERVVDKLNTNYTPTDQLFGVVKVFDGVYIPGKVYIYQLKLTVAPTNCSTGEKQSTMCRPIANSRHLNFTATFHGQYFADVVQEIYIAEKDRIPDWMRVLLKEWQVYKSTFGKVYGEEEDKERKGIFLANLETIRKHNEAYARDEVTFSIGINRMSDWRDDEYKRLSGLKPTLLSKKWLKEHTRVVHTDEPVPDAIDWRSKDFVTKVKNQGDDCGVCWSFATTGLLEGAYKRHTGKLVSLSEQNLIDCVGHACEGNSINAGPEYVIRNNGIDTEANYPFTEASTHEVDSCRYQSNQALLTDLKQIVSAPPDDEEQLKILVAKYGPIAVAFNADGLSYKVSDGVHYNSTCNQGVVNHALLVVGYGRDNKKEMDFWIVKNSWGVTWGDGGYFLAARNQGNNCFIAQSAIYALFENEQ